MNLLIVTPELGAISETFIENHILNISPNKSYVITSKINKIYKNIPVLEIPLKYGPAVFEKEIEEKVKDFILKNQITHILIEYGTYGSEIIELNYRYFKLPIFVHFHGYDLSMALRNDIVKNYYKILPKYVTGSITVSFAMTNRLLALGIPKEKIYINTYGVEKQIFRLNKPKDKLKLLFVGRLVNKKNPIPILAAIKKLINTFNKFHFTIIGDGPLRVTIENYIYNNNLQEYVSLPGALDHNTVLKYFNNTDIYLQNSCIDEQTGDREGTPVSIMEAQSFGLPIIATKHEGINDIIINNYNGILVDENSTEGFYNALIKLINDFNLAKMIGTNASRIGNSKLSREYSNDKLRDIMLQKFQNNINQPFFSVCIPTYNRAKYIEDAIKSVFLQDFDDFEIIVVDDGSTDNTKEIIDKFPDARLKYFYKQHTNAPDTRNKAIEFSKGKFIVWLDSDDTMLPQTLKKYYIELLASPDIDMLYGDLVICDENLNPKRELGYINWYKKNNLLLSNLFQGNYIPNCVSCIRKESYLLYGNYDTSYDRAHDYEFWTRVVKFINLKKVNHFTAFWRWHDNNMSAESVKFDTSYEQRILKSMLERYSLEELFVEYNWKNDFQISKINAYLEISKRFIILKDYNTALEYANKAYELAPVEAISQLINSIKETIQNENRIP
ncbi:MAG TPA: glycosyltransferase [Ignavibacteriales bacterium]|nr:glycosyltransferase [Ignavibacteriales bacterium]HOL81824.1 glycosyltransferase [Ignavibacteriales bacterium]HOM65800.1 glycosyltransferase [Ignavibacteriales bacterium]HPD67097.1 glycosyltransferase [Ignavibacteriales bacterium]HPP33961.1 glycosyltransferase [Ignavibacteriales bacterium]